MVTETLFVHVRLLIHTDNKPEKLLFRRYAYGKKIRTYFEYAPFFFHNQALKNLIFETY